MRVGDLIADRFKLERLAGSGSMALVYRALDQKTGAPVAVKALRPQDPEEEERFAREASVLAELHHPGIVEYIGRGVADDGRPYLVMEWIEGESLAQRLARGPLSIADTVALGKRIAEALGIAHLRGVIHRDIKPSNLLLRGGKIETIMLLDFGVARRPGGLGLTQTGAMIGTPGYMAPEQARGQKDIDARADVFALGCVLFRCLTGRQIFESNDMLGSILKLMDQDAPRLASIIPSMPASIDNLLGQMLSRPREGRPRDGAAVAAALAALEISSGDAGPPCGAAAPSSSTTARTSTDPEQPRGDHELGKERWTLLGKPTPCVGRDREIGTLLSLWSACVTEPSARAVVLIAGPGVGKSRLRHEVVRRIDNLGYGALVLLSGGDEMNAGAPFGILAAALRRVAFALADEPLTFRRRKLAERLGRHLSHLSKLEQSRITRLLGELAFAPFPAQESSKLRAARTSPTLMGDQMRMAWEDWLAAECSAQPVLIVLEDLQWGDLPSVQFIDSTLRNLSARPLMILALGRPEVRQVFPDLWAGRQVTEIELKNLSRRSSKNLVRQVLGKSATQEAVERVVAQAAGNAFYLEELVRVVAEGRGETLPATVMAMLEARLADLGGEARHVLQAASIFGQVFWEGGVRALLGSAMEAAEIGRTVADLIQREVLTPQGQGRFAGELEYAFRHAMIREAAYTLLTNADRALGHLLAAEWLERAGESEALAIAEHFDRAGQEQRAIVWYLRAAEQALEGCDDAAVLTRGQRGIACGAEGEELGQLRLLLAQAYNWRGENAEAEAQALDAMRWLPLGTAAWYTAVGEAASASVRQGGNDRLVELAAVLHDAVLAGERSGKLWIAAARSVVHLYQIGREDLGATMLDLLLSATYAGADLELEVRGRLRCACAKRAQHEGVLEAYLEHRQAAAADLEQAGDLRNACIERVNVGFALIELGSYAEAERALRDALAAAERLDLRTGRAAACQNLGFALAHLDALDEALRIERQAVAQFAAQGNRRMEGGSRIYLAEILERLGDLEDAEREARTAAELLFVAPPLRPYALAMQANMLLRLERVEEARDVAQLAVDLIAALGNVTEDEAQVFLVYAEILEATRDHAEARAVIASARSRLLARASRIRDAAWRKSFLQNVPAHARTLELATAWKNAK
jgi:tetratricopeptide (TPR) repeat protein